MRTLQESEHQKTRLEIGQGMKHHWTVALTLMEEFPVQCDTTGPVNVAAMDQWRQTLRNLKDPTADTKELYEFMSASPTWRKTVRDLKTLIQKGVLGWVVRALRFLGGIQSERNDVVEGTWEEVWEVLKPLLEQLLVVVVGSIVLYTHGWFLCQLLIWICSLFLFICFLFLVLFLCFFLGKHIVDKGEFMEAFTAN